MAGFTAADVPRLKLKWAFGFPGDLQANAQATIAGGRVFVGSAGGKVYSLSAATGCVHWFFEAGAPVRAAISIGSHRTRARAAGYAAFFGDGTGERVCGGRRDRQAAVEDEGRGFSGRADHRVAGLSQRPRSMCRSPPVKKGRAPSPDYECCRFRGSLVALDAATGKQIWKTYTIPEEPDADEEEQVGTQLWGPSGAPVWSSPAIDVRRNALYVTTGDNYSDPPSRMSDAFVAIDLKSGKILWWRQMTPADAYMSACRLPDKTNCRRLERARLRLQRLADSRHPGERHAAPSSPARSPGSSTRSIPTGRAT